MSRPFLIPEMYHNDVLRLSAEGKEAKAIELWLAQEPRFIHVTVACVLNLLSSKRKERQEIAKMIYADEVAKSANMDIKILSNMIDRCYLEANKAFDEDKPMIGARLADTLIKYVDRRMMLSGIDKPEENDEIILESLMAKLGKHVVSN
jgi:hypothetical protein